MYIYNHLQKNVLFLFCLTGIHIGWVFSIESHPQLSLAAIVRPRPSNPYSLHPENAHAPGWQHIIELANIGKCLSLQHGQFAQEALCDMLSLETRCFSLSLSLSLFFSLCLVHLGTAFARGLHGACASAACFSCLFKAVLPLRSE